MKNKPVVLWLQRSQKSALSQNLIKRAVIDKTCERITKKTVN